jgi:hypothetical protein
MRKERPVICLQSRRIQAVRFAPNHLSLKKAAQEIGVRIRNTYGSGQKELLGQRSGMRHNFLKTEYFTNLRISFSTSMRLKL